MLQVRPLVVDKDMVVIGGNMRLRALRELGYKKVPVDVVDWTEQQKQEFLIKDNMSFGKWSFDILANTYDADQLVHWGFNEWELGGYESSELLDEPSDDQPIDSALAGTRAADEEYLRWEVIVDVETRKLAIDVIKRIKSIHNFDTTGMAFRHLLESYSMIENPAFVEFEQQPGLIFDQSDHKEYPLRYYCWAKNRGLEYKEGCSWICDGGSGQHPV